jgi:hypothetical protein
MAKDSWNAARTFRPKSERCVGSSSTSNWQPAGSRGGRAARHGRYLVTYMNSLTGGKVRSSTIVSITNQSASRT